MLWLVSCLWNNSVLGFPYVRGLGYQRGRSGNGECSGLDVTMKKRPSLSHAVLEEEITFLVAEW